MCRLYAHRAIAPTPVAGVLLDDRHALIVQSRGDLRGETHPDGWGLGYYEAGAPRVVRSTENAAQSAEFASQARLIVSTTVVAHVRQASVGARLQANVHPFVFGSWMFAHNGTVTGFDQVRPQLESETDDDLLARIEGTTDSELAFYWLLSRLRAGGQRAEGPCRDLRQLQGVVAEAVSVLARRSEAAGPADVARLNFVLTDGVVLVATRWKHTLHWHSQPRDFSNAIGQHAAARILGGAALVAIASEPIGDRTWTEVSDASVFAVDGDLMARTTAI